MSVRASEKGGGERERASGHSHCRIRGGRLGQGGWLPCFPFPLEIQECRLLLLPRLETILAAVSCDSLLPSPSLLPFRFSREGVRELEILHRAVSYCTRTYVHLALRNALCPRTSKKEAKGRLGLCCPRESRQHITEGRRRGSAWSCWRVSYMYVYFLEKQFSAL